MNRTNASGFVLLPVILTLALLAVVTALLLERGGIGSSVAAAQQQSDALAYAAEAGFNHGRALLEQNGCLTASTVPDTELGDYTYSAVMPGTGTSVPPATYKLTAVADAWLNQDSQSSNYGSDQVLKTNKDGDDRQIVLRFDLSGVPPTLAVASATLRLYVKKANSDAVDIHRVTYVWNESTVTWNNTENDYDKFVEQATFVPGAIGPLNIDLTPLVRQWVAGKVPNNGIMFVSEDDDSEFHSREDGNASFRPRLDIVSRPNAFYDLTATGQDAAGIERSISRTIEGPADSALFLDYFDAGYAGNDGTQDFSSAWKEVGESDGPDAGGVRIVGLTTNCAYDNCLRMDENSQVRRQLNLAGASSAILRLHRRRLGRDFTLEVSRDSGGWQTLRSDVHETDGTQVREVFDISTYAAADTRIRITTTSNICLFCGPRYLYVDDVEVEATCGP